MNQTQNTPNRTNQFMRTRPARNLSSAGLGWLALCWVLLLPAAGHCYTEVSLYSWDISLTKSQTIRSSPPNAPIETSWSISTNGGGLYGWTEAASRVFGRAEVGTLKLYAYTLALAQVSPPYGNVVVASQAIGTAHTSHAAQAG